MHLAAAPVRLGPWRHPVFPGAMTPAAVKTSSHSRPMSVAACSGLACGPSRTTQGHGPSLQAATAAAAAAAVAATRTSFAGLPVQQHQQQQRQHARRRGGVAPLRAGASGAAGAGSGAGSSSGSGGTYLQGETEVGVSRDMLASIEPAMPIAAVTVTLATTAVAAAAAAAVAPPPPPPQTSALALLLRASELVRTHLWGVLLVYAMKDALAFALHRLTQRLTNHAAEVVLGVPVVSAGNPFWLLIDPSFLRANPGYEIFVGFFFLLSLPVNILLSSAAFAAATYVVTGRAQAALEKREQQAATAKARKAMSQDPNLMPEDDPRALHALADLGIRSQEDDASSIFGSSGSRQQPPAASSGSSSSSAGSSSKSGYMGAPIGTAASLPAYAPPATATAASNSSGSSSSEPLAGSAVQADPGVDAASSAAGNAATDEDAAATAAAVAAPAPGPGLLAPLRRAAALVWAVWPEVKAVLARVWWVDLQVNVRALPLQGLCLAVLPAFWALPRLMRIQLALPAALLEAPAPDAKGALGRSGALMQRSVAAYAAPFALLLGLSRAVDYVQSLALMVVPSRWWRDVVELPLAIAAGFLLLKLVVMRLQDLLPLAAYLNLSDQERDSAQRAAQEAQAEVAAKLAESAGAAAGDAGSVDGGAAAAAAPQGMAPA